MTDLSIIEPKVQNYNGQVVTTSLNIAEVFGKEHKNVLQDIRNTVEKVSDDFGRLNFQLSSYHNEQNKEQPMFYLTRDGATMLIMGYTSERAFEFKEAYIKAFNQMEEQLRNVPVQPSTPLEEKFRIASLILGTAGITGNPLTLALDQMAKKEFGESLLEATGVQLVAPVQTEYPVSATEAAKAIGLSVRKLNLYLESVGMQYKDPNGKWLPTENGKHFGLGVVFDTNKKYATGTPVPQFKLYLSKVKELL